MVFALNPEKEYRSVRDEIPVEAGKYNCANPLHTRGCSLLKL